MGYLYLQYPIRKHKDTRKMPIKVADSKYVAFFFCWNNSICTKLFLLFLHSSVKVIVLQKDNQWRCWLSFFLFLIFSPSFPFCIREHTGSVLLLGGKGITLLLWAGQWQLCGLKAKEEKKTVWGSGCGFSAAQTLPMFCFSLSLHSNDPLCSLVTLLEGISSR